jgi:hypothetical protein
LSEKFVKRSYAKNGRLRQNVATRRGEIQGRP